MLSLLLVVLYFVIVYFVANSIMKIHQKRNLKFKRLSTALSFAFAAIVSGYGLFMVAPLMTPVITMSNGVKTIEFYGMQHLGKASYYQEVGSAIKHARKSGYTIVYEGVGLKDAELPKEPCVIKSNNILGTMKQPLCFGNIQSSDIIADMTKDEYIQAMVDSAIARGHDKDKAEANVEEASKLLSSKMNNILYENPFGHIFAKVVIFNDNTNMMTGLMVEESIQEYKPSRKEAPKLVDPSIFEGVERDAVLIKQFISNDVVIHRRNDIIVDAINNSENDNILITYGRAHIYGVFYALKEQDPNWKIVDKRLITAM